MSDKQPMAIYLAHWLQHGQTGAVEDGHVAASNELIRLHYINATLLQALRDIYEASNDVGAVACAAGAITKTKGDSK